MSDQPRQYTVEEMRELFLAHFRSSVDYWAAPAQASHLGQTWSIHDRMAGLAHSLLVALDGGASELPGFKLIPEPCHEDEAYHRDEGENWWGNEPIHDGSTPELHSEFYNSPAGLAWQERWRGR